MKKEFYTIYESILINHISIDLLQKIVGLKMDCFCFCNQRYYLFLVCAFILSKPGAYTTQNITQLPIGRSDCWMCFTSSSLWWVKQSKDEVWATEMLLLSNFTPLNFSDFVFSPNWRGLKWHHLSQFNLFCAAPSGSYKLRYTELLPTSKEVYICTYFH